MGHLSLLADYTVSHTDLAENLFLLSRATQNDPIVWGCFWRVVMSRIRLANGILKFIYENTNLPMCTSPRRRPGGGPAERSEQHCAGRRSTLDYTTGSIEWPQCALSGCPLPLARLR